MPKLNPPPTKKHTVKECIDQLNDEDKDFINAQRDNLRFTEMLIAEFTLLLSDYTHIKKGQLTWCYYQALNHFHGIPEELED